jgi:single-strand DNA-binding protein
MTRITPDEGHQQGRRPTAQAGAGSGPSRERPATARGWARIQLIGNVGRDAELQYLPGGTARATFRLAVNRRERAADGSWSDVADWFGVVAWEALGERCGEQLTRGAKVFVDGRPITRTYRDRQGVERHVVEIVAHDVLLLGVRQGSGAGAGGEPASPAAPSPASGDGSPAIDDDLPF